MKENQQRKQKNLFKNTAGKKQKRNALVFQKNIQLTVDKKTLLF